MASPVYSTQFVQAPGFSGAAAVQYVVPAGFRAVVKCITMVYGDVTASGADAWVQSANLTKLARYTWAFTVSDPTNFGGTALFYGSWVLESADTLAIQTAAGTLDFYASGYLLALP